MSGFAPPLSMNLDGLAVCIFSTSNYKSCDDGDDGDDRDDGDDDDDNDAGDDDDDDKSDRS